MSRVLLYFSIKYHGDWDQIYDALERKEKVDREEVLKTEKDLKCKYITILDNEYPNKLRNSHRPPFVLFYAGNAKLLLASYKIAGLITSQEQNYDPEDIKKACSTIKEYRLVPALKFDAGATEVFVEECVNNSIQTICIIEDSITSSLANHPIFKKVIKDGGVIVSEKYDLALNNNIINNQAHSNILSIGGSISPTKAIGFFQIMASLTRNVIFYKTIFRPEWIVIFKYALDHGNNMFAISEDENSVKQYIRNGVIVTDDLIEIMETI
jgi:DNA processing protein